MRSSLISFYLGICFFAAPLTVPFAARAQESETRETKTTTRTKKTTKKKKSTTTVPKAESAPSAAESVPAESVPVPPTADLPGAAAPTLPEPAKPSVKTVEPDVTPPPLRRDDNLPPPHSDVELGTPRIPGVSDGTQDTPVASGTNGAPEGPRRFGAAITGSILGLMIPFKYGASLTYIQSQKWRFELGYFAGAYEVRNSIINLGGFREQLITLDGRRFVGHSSFNFILGLSEQQYIAKVGSDIAQRASGIGEYDLLNVQTLGLQVGLSNIWIIHGFTIGADWLVLNFPFLTLHSETPAISQISNGADRGTIDDVIRIMRYVPTGAIAKLNLGYTF